MISAGLNSIPAPYFLSHGGNRWSYLSFAIYTAFSKRQQIEL